MKKLNSAVLERYAYAKNGVVFDIKTYDNGDSCVIAITSDNVDNITVNGDKLYLDSYIEDGDTYADSKFHKTAHNEEASGETTVTLTNFYKSECEAEIAKALIGQYYNTYEDFSKDLSMLGVPRYMIKQGGDTVVPATIQIDFTEDYYNAVKMNEVKSLVLQSAKNTANHYGYKLTKPAKEEELEIEKIEG
jgi:hypothetical protein